VVAPVQSPRDSVDLVAPPQEQLRAPTATDSRAVGGGWLGTLRTSVAPRGDHSAEERQPQAQGPDGPADNILRAASGHLTSNRQSTTKGQDNSFAGPFGLSEEALLRLEAGLRAQREHLLAQSGQLANAPGICPIDGDEACQSPDKLSLPSIRTVFHAPDTTQRLPRAAQLNFSPAPSTADSEVHVQTQDARAPQSLAPFSTRDRRRNWRLLLIISISTIIAGLIGGTFPATERTSINADVIAPAQTKAIAPELPSTAPENNHVNNQPSNDLAASAQIKLELQATTSISPGVSAQPAAPIQASADRVISNQSNGPSTVMLPAGGDTSSPKSRPGRKATRAQRPQAKLPSPG
jgi:hypothetical protein